MVINWLKVEAGYYESETGRFYIMKTYDRIYGEHWVLYDNNEPNRYKGRYDERTLRECKEKAEAL